jgi:hypothetical protein
VTKTTITVTTSEHEFKRSKTENIPIHTVTFNLVDKGRVPHTIRIIAKTSKLIGPGWTRTPRHAEMGMPATLTVAGWE